MWPLAKLRKFIKWQLCSLKMVWVKTFVVLNENNCHFLNFFSFSKMSNNSDILSYVGIKSSQFYRKIRPNFLYWYGGRHGIFMMKFCDINIICNCFNSFFSVKNCFSTCFYIFIIMSVGLWRFNIFQLISVFNLFSTKVLSIPIQQVHKS